jgi:hypothetical protein
MWCQFLGLGRRNRPNLGEVPPHDSDVSGRQHLRQLLAGTIRDEAVSAVGAEEEGARTVGVASLHRHQVGHAVERAQEVTGGGVERRGDGLRDLNDDLVAISPEVDRGERRAGLADLCQRLFVILADGFDELVERRKLPSGRRHVCFPPDGTSERVPKKLPVEELLSCVTVDGLVNVGPLMRAEVLHRLTDWHVAELPRDAVDQLAHVFSSMWGTDVLS